MVKNNAVHSDGVDWKEINRIRTTEVNHGGWTFRTRRSHILGTEGQYAWKRELSCFQGQSLPDAIFHNNSLEICHQDTGIRIRFCALEALRAWTSLDLDPVKTQDASNQHWTGRTKSFPASDYDYTYTTLYPGGTDVSNTTKNNNSSCEASCLSDNCDSHYLQADSSSFVPKRTSDDDNSELFGRARLRKPICKCKGEGGRAPFVNKRGGRDVAGPDDEQRVNDDTGNHGQSANHGHTNATPKWHLTTTNRVDVEGMIQEFPKPICYEVVDLYEDDLHDNGTCFLKAKVYVTPIGWAALLRCFVRVDGVMARVLDTRFTHFGGETHILRERSWKEGK